jgi:hypothetical protein
MMIQLTPQLQQRKQPVAPMQQKPVAFGYSRSSHWSPLQEAAQTKLAPTATNGRLNFLA